MEEFKAYTVLDAAEAEAVYDNVDVNGTSCLSYDAIDAEFYAMDTDGNDYFYYIDIAIRF